MAQGGPLGPQGSHRPGSRLVDAHLGAGARGRNTVTDKERERKIADVEEEITWLKSLSIPLKDIAAAMRCGRRAAGPGSAAEAILADLKKGMQP